MGRAKDTLSTNKRFATTNGKQKTYISSTTEQVDKNLHEFSYRLLEVKR